MRNAFVAIIACLLFTVLLVVFCGQLGLGGEFSEDIGGTLEAPSIWDLLTFNAGVFWGLLTFTYAEVPYLVSILLWFVQAVVLVALIFLIRGVS